MTDGVVEQIQLQLRALQISREYKGISTAAEWVTSLRAEGSLAVNSFSIDTFLQGCAVNWWPTAGVVNFPPFDATETAICQPFVTARINEIASCDGKVYRKMLNENNAYSTQSNERVEFRSVPVDGHAVVSYSGRKPDIPCYHGVRRGGCSITLLGDVMGTALMTKEQFARTFLFCFLTDGYRFQFFRCSRSQQGDGSIRYEQSALYDGEHGWQV